MVKLGKIFRDEICKFYEKYPVVIKKYKDQEPPYLMRQICVLQWEEIKTKNSGATHHFCPKGGIRIYSYCIFHIDQKAKNHKYSL